jgi:hypothetical protein
MATTRSDGGKRQLHGKSELHRNSCYQYSNSSVPLNLGFVVVRQGKEIHTVLDSNAIATVFTKVE